MSTATSQQFEGSTIEEALAEAVSTLGDDLEIIDAQRVRKRTVLGRRRERYEVTASARSGEAFDSVLRRMVDRVDTAERKLGGGGAAERKLGGAGAVERKLGGGGGGTERRIGGRRRRRQADVDLVQPDAGADLVDTDNGWWSSAEFVLPEPVPAPARTSRPPQMSDIELDVREQLARKAMAQNEHTVPTPQEEAAAADPAPAPAPESPAQTVLPDTVEAGPAWGSEALLDLGLPPALVGRLTVKELHGDLAWVAALAGAIEELLATAEGVSGPCELTGHGSESAVHLIMGACDGFRIGSLVIDGRRVEATPMELALAIRSLLRDQQP